MAKSLGTPCYKPRLLFQATEYEDSKKVHENEMQLLIQKLAEKAKNGL